MKLQKIVKEIKKDFLLNNIKAIRYNDDKSSVKLFYNDLIITLNDNGAWVGGWLEGSITVHCAKRLAEIIERF